MRWSVPELGTNLGTNSDPVPDARLRHLLQRLEDRAIRLRQLFENREVVVLRDREIAAAQSVRLPRRGVLLRLAHELGQLAEADRHHERRRVPRQVAHRTVALRLGRIQAELLAQITQTDRLEGEDTAVRETPAETRRRHTHRAAQSTL